MRKESEFDLSGVGEDEGKGEGGGEMGMTICGLIWV
jgi:hypothetical protein